LSELIGITPRSDDSIDVDPLIPSTWKYFIAENIPYHGHNVTVLYDQDGTRYKVGTGMKVYVNGKQVVSQPIISGY
jgi:cellobiose phosphorylase